MTKRDEFPKKVKIAAFERANGRCECGCGLKIIGIPEYDHYPVPAALGGPGTIENCRVLSRKCHRRITAEGDQPAIAKSTRGYEKRLNARSKGRGFRSPPPGFEYDWKRGGLRRAGSDD